MGKETFHGPLEQVDECCWRIPKSYKQGMRVDGLIYTNEKLLEQLKLDQAPEQVANVAFLPGIQHASLAMPDIHWGYGFCIGGVCATDPAEGGVISPGGVGYDINCGVRLIRSNLFYRDVKPHMRTLVEELFRQVPTGVGKSGRFSFNEKELKQIMSQGPQCLVQRGWATAGDIDHTEARGRLDGADPDAVSERALMRGASQCGTLGSGNHFLEVQIVDHVFDEPSASAMGLEKDMVCVMIHSGSRGLGYQVCDDALAMLRKVPGKIRHCPARPPTGMCARRQSGRPALHRDDARGGELRLVQSTAFDAPVAGSVRNRIRTHLARASNEPHLRCVPQHRQVRGAHLRRQDQEGLGSPEGRHARVSAQPPGGTVGVP